MTFKTIATVATVIAAAALAGGCSAIPPDVYGAFGRLVPAQQLSAEAALAAPASADPTLVAADPAPRIRYEIMRQGRRAN